MSLVELRLLNIRLIIIFQLLYLHLSEHRLLIARPAAGVLLGICEQTFFSMFELLSRDEQFLVRTFRNWHFRTLVPSNFLAVGSDNGPAVGGLPHGAGEGVGQPGVGGGARLVVVELLSSFTVDNRNNWNNDPNIHLFASPKCSLHTEVDLFVDQFTLQPGHGVTRLVPGPHLWGKGSIIYEIL